MKGLGAIISTALALATAGAMGASIERRTLPAVSVKGNGQLPLCLSSGSLLDCQVANAHLPFSFLCW
jgi:hypothetical protein